MRQRAREASVALLEAKHKHERNQLVEPICSDERAEVLEGKAFGKSRAQVIAGRRSSRRCSGDAVVTQFVAGIELAQPDSTRFAKNTSWSSQKSVNQADEPFQFATHKSRIDWQNHNEQILRTSLDKCFQANQTLLSKDLSREYESRRSKRGGSDGADQRRRLAPQKLCDVPTPQ